MDVVSGLGALTQAANILKSLRGIEKTYDLASLKMQLADLMNAVADGRMALSEAKEEIAQKDVEIERLRASFQAKADLVVGDGDYKYRSDDAGRPVGYPMCPQCDEVDGRVIQLKRNDDVRNAKCPACKSEFNPVTAYRPHGAPGAATEWEEEIRLRTEGMERLNRKLGEYNRGGNYY